MLCYVPLVEAQQNTVLLERDYTEGIERSGSQQGNREITGLKPVLESRIELSNVLGYKKDTTVYYYDVTEKLFRDHFLDVRDGDARLTLDPLFVFQTAYEKGNITPYADTNTFFQNTRGFMITADLGHKVSFRTMFHETQTKTMQYIREYARQYGTISGQARVKFSNATKLDYGFSQANVSYSPTKWLNIQLGHDKHFVGHGYRSVLLSDNMLPAPYLQFSYMSPNKRWQYTTWHTKLQHGVTTSDRSGTGTSSESLFSWMRARFHHLGVRLGGVEIGLFEATIFRNMDSTGVMPFDPLELNPVIGVNALVNGFDGPYKSLLGLDIKVNLVYGAYVYGQLATDGLRDQQYAWQAGVRMFDVVWKDLNIQFEYNTVQPFMYTASPVQLSYVHSGLAMAHPMGANFSEALVVIDKAVAERFRIQAQFNLALYHPDTSLVTNRGSDLNRSSDGIRTNEGPEQRLFYMDLNMSYLFNPKTNLRFTAGVRRRDLPTAGDGYQSTFIYLSFGTSIFNRYYDI